MSGQGSMLLILWLSSALVTGSCLARLVVSQQAHYLFLSIYFLAETVRLSREWFVRRKWLKYQQCKQAALRESIRAYESSN